MASETVRLLCGRMKHRSVHKPYLLQIRPFELFYHGSRAAVSAEVLEDISGCVFITTSLAFCNYMMCMRVENFM